MKLTSRVEKLEAATHRGPAIYATWNEEDNCYLVGDVKYPSVAAVEAAYPGREVNCFRVVWDGKPPAPGDKVITWEDADPYDLRK